ncbi:MAG TPA: SRPBCC domain-containing protein [Actinophytocola sp.]|uniref:SRPBCC domain-containing protein n=1 Tax=Actinophytocola sp. TaxID=1872138 RepID=UPI002DB610DF|nr:SRPBCC domain-containing protein [Actinophytocola sp.]HEU5469100.1 SRPBCC domain-containing protein [Actinophytocola sp.]
MGNPDKARADRDRARLVTMTSENMSPSQARVSSETVREATGRGWSEWLELLDEAGAVEWDHRRIVAYLEAEYAELTGWWRQSITVGYERARGLRAVGETSSGFQVGVQRAVPATPDEVFALLVSQPELWLGEKIVVEPGVRFAGGEIRVVKPADRIRWKWQAAGWDAAATLQLTILTSKSGTTAVHVQVEKLPDTVAREAMRAHWRGVLEKVAGALVSEDAE